jgi:DNA modification methylase
MTALNRDVTLINTDCAKALRVLDAESVDAIVTDPPYEIGFNGNAWDRTGIAYDVAMWSETLRIVKPGSYLLAFGGTRTFHRMTSAIEDAGFEIQDCLAWLYGSGFPKHRSKLKPAWEPIVLARKHAPKATPLNVDGCLDNGRWPANVILDEVAAAMLDQAADADGKNIRPSRFFYIAKPTTDERDAGLAGSGLRRRSPGLLEGLKNGKTAKARFNYHPTVKPIALMRRLVRLITPENGAVLDPFTGSGTTGCAAVLEGARFVGIERERKFFAIADARIRHWKGVAHARA